MGWQQRVRATSAVILLVATGLADAQPAEPVPAAPSPARAETPEPLTPSVTDEELAAEAPLTSVPVDEDPPPPYPRALAARPLVLPSGMLEAGLSFDVVLAEISQDAESATGMDAGIRHAVGPVELEGGLGVVLAVPDGVEVGDRERLGGLFGAVRYAISPDLSVGVQLLARGPVSEYTTLTPRVVLAYKVHPTPDIAFEALVAPGLWFASVDSEDVMASATAFVSAGVVKGQLQLAPLIGVESFAVLQVRHQPDGDGSAWVSIGDRGTQLAHEVGVRILASITPIIDISIGGAVLTSAHPRQMMCSLGLSIRHRP